MTAQGAAGREEVRGRLVAQAPEDPRRDVLIHYLVLERLIKFNFKFDFKPLGLGPTV